MRCLSVNQPFASLIIDGFKNTEFRPRDTKVRGDILIHASKGMSKFCVEFCYEYGISHEKLLKGKIIGIVRLDDTNNYGENWGWLLSNPRKFKKPIPYKGMLGFFEVPDGVLEGKR